MHSCSLCSDWSLQSPQQWEQCCHSWGCDLSSHYLLGEAGSSQWEDICIAIMLIFVHLDSLVTTKDSVACFTLDNVQLRCRGSQWNNLNSQRQEEPATWSHVERNSVPSTSFPNILHFEGATQLHLSKLSFHSVFRKLTLHLCYARPQNWLFLKAICSHYSNKVGLLWLYWKFNF